MDELPPYALEVNSDTALLFTLTRSTTSLKNDRSVITLRHPGRTKNALAFKVKTTQPRRYQVRPNQGIVKPGTTESVTILLIDKDRQSLLESYDTLGRSALENSKDKFLVQSCIVGADFVRRYDDIGNLTTPSSESGTKAGKEIAEALTEMWNNVTKGGLTPIHNRKLHVRHVVGTETGKDACMSSAKQAVQPNVESMSRESMVLEIISLRRKHDDLVSFSINLTTERDILNNTLEQTKRDLNREVAARFVLENNEGLGRATVTKFDERKGSIPLYIVVFISFLCFFIGIKASNMESFAVILRDIPFLGTMLGIEGNGGMGQEL